MDIGLGTIAALWMLSGVPFWGAFVALGLDFRALNRGGAAGSEARAR